MSKSNQINVFIVEDNELFRLTLKSEIESTFIKMPIKIHSFGTGEDCMKKFKEERPQVVVLDYNLNSKQADAANGIKVLDWIKKENPETNVIMLTGEDNLEIALKAFKHGASDYVVKTETKFRKINYSLFNIFRTIEAKKEARSYKKLSVLLFFCLALLVGFLIAIQVFGPSLFN